MASCSARRKQAIRDQKEPRTHPIPKRWKGKETTVEGSIEKQIEGQLCPYGSRRRTNQMPPDQTQKTNKPPPYMKAQAATTQPTATTLTMEAATTQVEMDEEKVNRLVAELKGLNDDVQDKVLNGAFVGQEDF